MEPTAAPATQPDRIRGTNAAKSHQVTQVVFLENIHKSTRHIVFENMHKSSTADISWEKIKISKDPHYFFWPPWQNTPSPNNCPRQTQKSSRQQTINTRRTPTRVTLATTQTTHIPPKHHPHTPQNNNSILPTFIRGADNQHKSYRTRDESQRIAVQDYSHAYNTPFKSSRLQGISVRH